MNGLNSIEPGQRIDTINAVLLDFHPAISASTMKWAGCWNKYWEECIVKYVDADYIIISDDDIWDYILINYKSIFTGDE